MVCLACGSSEKETTSLDGTYTCGACGASYQTNRKTETAKKESSDTQYLQEISIGNYPIVVTNITVTDTEGHIFELLVSGSHLNKGDSLAIRFR